VDEDDGERGGAYRAGRYAGPAGMSGPAGPWLAKPHGAGDGQPIRPGDYGETDPSTGHVGRRGAAPGRTEPVRIGSNMDEEKC
jgi:hypothetical protein